MDPTVIGLLTILLCFVLILTEMHVGFAIATAGLVGVFLLGDAGIVASTLAEAPYSATANFVLFAVPTYVLLGCMISNCGLGTNIYRVVARILSWLPGGLGATAVLATSVFSGISGSSAADTAVFGRISVREMAKHGYTVSYASAIVAAAGTFAVLIPPSIVLVLYALVAGVSVGAMIVAAILPGIISCVILAVFVIARAIWHGRTRSRTRSTARTSEAVIMTPALVAAGAPSLPVGSPGGTEVVEMESAPAEQDAHSEVLAGPIRGADIAAIGYAVVLFAIVIGGLYAGVFTATEAGAVGCLAAALIVVKVTWGQGTLLGILKDSMAETVRITSMIFILLVGGTIFAYSIALSALPKRLSTWVGGLDVAPLLVLALLLLMLIPLGAFLDGLSVMLLTVPIMSPIAVAFGHDPIWFGILVLKMIEIGLITPPVGINAFIISGITGAPVAKVYRLLVPFVLLDLCVTGLFFAFPDVVLWLPRMSGLV